MYKFSEFLPGIINHSYMKEAWVKLYQNQKVDYVILFLFLISNVFHITQVTILYFIMSLQNIFLDGFDLCVSYLCTT